MGIVCPSRSPEELQEFPPPRRRGQTPVEGEAAVLPGGRGGQQRGRRQVREPLPGWKWKGGLRVCSQAGNHPRPPTKSPGETRPAPGLEEEAAGDSTISRGLGARVPRQGR